MGEAGSIRTGIEPVSVARSGRHPPTSASPSGVRTCSTRAPSRRASNDPGQGPGLHRHPYSETWSVLEGQATITIGDETVVARAGDTAVVPPDVWHGFTNTGTGILRMMCIHASDTMIQENR